MGKHCRFPAAFETPDPATLLNFRIKESLRRVFIRNDRIVGHFETSLGQEEPQLPLGYTCVNLQMPKRYLYTSIRGALGLRRQWCFACPRQADEYDVLGPMKPKVLRPLRIGLGFEEKFELIRGR